MAPPLGNMTVKCNHILLVIIALSVGLMSAACGHIGCRQQDESCDTVAARDMMLQAVSTGQVGNIAVDFSGVGTVESIDGIAEQVLKRTSYVVSYNKDTRCPNWVAWRLTAAHTTGDVKRMGNAFHEDMDVPAPRALNSDYKDSGYSRGHLCPAGDNKWDKDAMYETFLLSNVCPQNANLNSGVWNQIEMSCRRWAERDSDLYIITGPMYFRSSKRRYIGENRVAVPDAFFKVILCLRGPKAIGFICRNTEGKGRKDQYTYSLSQLERLTGLHFFPLLDSNTRSLIEDNADLTRW